MHALILASHIDQRDRYLSILKQSMQKFDDWYGPYPYKQITLIDPEPGSEIGGMEYPTLITGGAGLVGACVVPLRYGNYDRPRVRPSVLVWHGRHQ